MSDYDEVLDLVDKDDSIIGTITRGEGMCLPADKGRYIRFASVLIMNAEGKLWLPVRSLSKAIAPGGYDNGAEGHVAHGETYEQCALRELEEESGIKAKPEELEEIDYAKFPGLPYFAKYFLLRTNQNPRLSSEHTSGEWLTLQGAREAISSGARPVKETVAYGISLVGEYLSRIQQ